MKSQKEYIAVIEKSKKSDYSVIFPDFLGCVTAGKNLQEARKMAEEALQFHIDGMIEDKEELPAPASLDKVKAKYKKAEIFLLVPVKVPTKSVRINLTIDEKLLRKLDKYLESSGEDRSKFFAQSIKEKVLNLRA